MTQLDRLTAQTQTAQDLKVMIDGADKSLRSGMLDVSDRRHIQQWKEELQLQLADLERGVDVS